MPPIVIVADASTDIIPIAVNGGAMALLAALLLWWLPQLVKAFQGNTKILRYNTETIELQARAMIVLSTKIGNPRADIDDQAEAVLHELDRSKRRAGNEDSTD